MTENTNCPTSWTPCAYILYGIAAFAFGFLGAIQWANHAPHCPIRGRKRRDYATLFDLMDAWLEQHPDATDDEAFEAVCWRNTKGALNDDRRHHA